MDDAQIKRRALREVGDTGRDALWEVTLPQSTGGGVWFLAFGGDTSAALNALAGRATVQLVLEAMPSIGAGNVLVEGVPRGPFRIQFTGALGAQKLDRAFYALTANGAGLTPPAALTPDQLDAGDSPALTSIAAELLSDMDEVSNPKARLLMLKIALLETLLGGSHVAIDVQTAQRMERLSQQHSNLLQLLDRAQSELHQLLNLGSTSARAGQSVSGKIRRQTVNGLPYGVMGRNPITGRLL